MTTLAIIALIGYWVLSYASLIYLWVVVEDHDLEGDDAGIFLFMCIATGVWSIPAALFSLVTNGKPLIKAKGQQP